MGHSIFANREYRLARPDNSGRSVDSPVSLGFQSDRLLTFQLALPRTKYSPEKGAAFYHSLLESLRATPGVRAAAASSGIPFGNGDYTTTPIATTGQSALPPDTAVPTDWRVVSAGFFHAMSIPLLRGRDFADTDAPPGAPLVVIVSQTTARRFWGDADPLGRTLHRQGDLTRQYAVVGVVGDVRQNTLSQRTREIGLRMALGAPRGRVLLLIVREGMVVGAIGIGVGIAGALALSRALASLVFDVPVRDPLTYAAVAAALTLVALAACVIPARNASRVDPMVTLRCD